MASKNLSEVLAVKCYAASPNITSDWFDMGQYGSFLAIVCPTVIAGTGITTFQLVGSSNSSGVPFVLLAQHPIANIGGTVGDNVQLHVTSNQLENAGVNLRYVTAFVDSDVGSSFVLTCIRGNPKTAHAGLTADSNA